MSSDTLLATCFRNWNTKLIVDCVCSPQFKDEQGSRAGDSEYLPSRVPTDTIAIVFECRVESSWVDGGDGVHLNGSTTHVTAMDVLSPTGHVP